MFQDFFRSFQKDIVGPKYRNKLAQVAVSNGRSLIIDFEDLIVFDAALARSVVEHPDDFVGYAQSAATAQMRVEDPEYAEQTGRIFARFRRLPEKVALGRIGAELLQKMVLVEGIVVRMGDVKPTLVRAAFRCRKCLEVMHEEQSGELMRSPGSTCPFCKQRSSFELLEEQSQFKNTQEIRIQETRGIQPRRSLQRFDIELEEDMIDTVKENDLVEVVAIVRGAFIMRRSLPTRTVRIFLEANSIEPIRDPVMDKSEGGN